MKNRFQYQNRCIICKSKFTFRFKRTICSECEKMQGKKLMNNNAKGYNKYVKNPKPKTKPKKSEFKQELDSMSIEQLIEKNRTLFKEQWKLKKEVLCIGQKISMIQEKLFGIKKLKEDAEKEL